MFHRNGMQCLIMLKILNKGHVIIEEGHPISQVYLIKEGESKILSTKLPIFTKFDQSEKVHHELFNKDLLSNKSYFSKTTSTF